MLGGTILLMTVAIVAYYDRRVNKPQRRAAATGWVQNGRKLKHVICKRSLLRGSFVTYDCNKKMTALGVPMWILMRCI